MLKRMIGLAVAGIFAPEEGGEQGKAGGGVSSQQGGPAGSGDQQGQSGSAGEGQQTGTGEGGQGQQSQESGDVTSARPDAVTDPAGGAAQGGDKKDEPNPTQTSSAT